MLVTPQRTNRNQPRGLAEGGKGTERNRCELGDGKNEVPAKHRNALLCRELTAIHSLNRYLLSAVFPDTTQELRRQQLEQKRS